MSDDNQPDQEVRNPCIRHCCLNDEDICLGCFRSLDEITGWYEANRDARLRILEKAARRQQEHEKRYPLSRTFR